MKRVFRVSKKGKVKPIVLSTLQTPEDLDAKLALIQALIPVGLLAVAEALKREVIALAGGRYCRTGGLPGIVRWSQQRGSIYLGDQKVAVTYRRRDRAQNREAPLQTYQGLQKPHTADGKLLLQILRGLVAPMASARKLRELCERRLESYDFVCPLPGWEDLRRG